ncbi:5-amino-6-(D-ribitylamino)uracil--L-tyrosine 4-hydroxyphenyl transferase CofH [Sphingobium sufflavum]|uniref:5-amino-6-(D-ribitylamino)uracil--L-tyrosine 4-hydroxyphenyl transferase CofH n=1 Tax=Sphingobium sufflavum TaxID=1129547 RepID=UPI001F441089|nr:5-amino-6-(D-ribitylamino)uracil--L-tyrosine 4-hydroxyphenyl transferase CofH [Sphingobium sufflavum]MCE7795457.1 5-amino-6-(D-ribitylamino)uracil--L-tyrosine 4-hydroxyphenyl transferase CofH [Sphingobium sufflavum]
MHLDPAGAPVGLAAATAHQAAPRPDPVLKDHLLHAPLDALLAEARALRDAGHGLVQSWSPKVFIPLTKLCRDYCHYCTFSRPAERGEAPYMTPDEILAVAREGASHGCTEALFTLGDKPELRHPAARAWLDAQGYASTNAYLAAMCALVVKETGLIPHVNAGIMTRDEMIALRAVSGSMGLMLESVSDRLLDKGQAHYRSPDKVPAVRLANIRMAGELAIPFTSGILIGIGETREERLDALFAMRDLNAEHGHIQEVIVQNFRAKDRTPMQGAAEPDMDDLLWTIAAARLILGAQMNIQAPPNLSSADFPRLMEAGINDWGGVSPVTPDHVNPEAPWPEIAALEAGTEAGGRHLVRRLPVYPSHLSDRWLAPAMLTLVRQSGDTHGWGREDAWVSGGQALPPLPRVLVADAPSDPAVTAALDALARGVDPDAALIETLFSARGMDVERVCSAANALRATVNGNPIGYVVNRNINYTNICAFTCGFCAFSKGKTHEDLRGTPYDLDHGEIARRVREAVARGASEVCLQGGIHPSYTGQTYLDILRTVKQAEPGVHVHAFSPLEVSHGAETLGVSIREFLTMLKAQGLGSLPGTAAEILHDDVREVICPGKLTTAQWLEVIGTAHEIGLATTATIMFGHVEQVTHWAAHLLAIRALQARTGGFTEFVPLSFVHMEAPIARKGLTRKGPTFREARLMHAVARLVLHPLIRNIQVSWTKLGPRGAAIGLTGGANDIGGTLMNESISKAAGSSHGQEFPPHLMDTLIHEIGRTPAPRTTLYGPADERKMMRARQAAPLEPVIQTPPKKVRKKLELEA